MLVYSMIKRKVQNSFDRIVKKIGSNTIALVSETDLKKMVGHGLGCNTGMAHTEKRIICIRQNIPLAEIKTVLWHEMAHILWPNQSHWWIECFSTVMSKDKTRAYMRWSKKYCHYTSEMESPRKLLEMARKRVIEIEK